MNKPNKNYHIFGIGSALVDLEITVSPNFLQRQGLTPGGMVLMSEEEQLTLLQQLDSSQHQLKRACGGSVANSLVAANRLGAQCYLCVQVANDENGAFFRQDLNRVGIDHNISSQLPSGTTGQCIVMVTPDSERTMASFLGIAQSLAPEDLNVEALIASQWLFVEGYLLTNDTTLATVKTAVKLARQNKVKIALSLSATSVVEMGRSALDDILAGGIDLLFGNIEESKLWAQEDSLDKTLGRMATVAESAVVTMSEQGAFVQQHGNAHKLQGCKTKALDSTGAGDMFAGTLLYGLVSSFSLAEAGRFANFAASKVVSTYGPRLAGEDYAELLRCNTKQHWLVS